MLLKIIHTVSLVWALGSLVVLIIFGMTPSPLVDSAKLVHVQLNIGIGVIAALLAIATRER